MRWIRLALVVLLALALAGAAQAQEDPISTDDALAVLGGFEQELVAERDALRAALDDPDTVVLYLPESERWIAMPRARAIELVDRLAVLALLNPGVVPTIARRTGMPAFIIEGLLETPNLAATQLIARVEAAMRPQLEAHLRETEDLIAELRGAIAELNESEPRAGGFVGVWTTTYGNELVLERRGDRVFGRYDSDNGRVDFAVTGPRTLDGYWIEDNSSRTCDSEIDGSRHWGRLVLEFDAGFRSYSGSWGYCDAEPSSGWYGELIR